MRVAANRLMGYRVLRSSSSLSNGHDSDNHDSKGTVEHIMVYHYMAAGRTKKWIREQGIWSPRRKPGFKCYWSSFYRPVSPNMTRRSPSAYLLVMVAVGHGPKLMGQHANIQVCHRHVCPHWRRWPFQMLDPGLTVPEFRHCISLSASHPSPCLDINSLTRQPAEAVVRRSTWQVQVASRLRENKMPSRRI